jgi:hypothetical protein
LSVVWVAEVLDIAEHPAEYCSRNVIRYTQRCECGLLRTTCLYCGSQDCGVDLGEE